MGNPKAEIVGINDPFLDAEYMAYMLKYDSVHGRFKGAAKAKDNQLVVNGKAINVYAVMRPEEIPWSACGAEYIVESAGPFTNLEAAGAHLKAGAHAVLVTAPAGRASRRNKYHSLQHGSSQLPWQGNP